MIEAPALIALGRRAGALTAPPAVVLGTVALWLVMEGTGGPRRV